MWWGVIWLRSDLKKKEMFHSFSLQFYPPNNTDELTHPKEWGWSTECCSGLSAECHWKPHSWHRCCRAGCLVYPVLVAIGLRQAGGSSKWVTSVMTKDRLVSKGFCSWHQIFHQQLPQVTSLGVCVCAHAHVLYTEWAAAVDFPPAWCVVANEVRLLSVHMEGGMHLAGHSGLQGWHENTFVLCILLVHKRLYRNSVQDRFFSSLKWIHDYSLCWLVRSVLPVLFSPGPPVCSSLFYHHLPLHSGNVYLLRPCKHWHWMHHSFKRLSSLLPCNP